MYIYRFVNQHDKVIYVGRTNNLIRRLRNEHFSNTGRGHLPQSCYDETARVEYASVTSQNEAKLYELYYIEKFHPKYNRSDIGGGAITFELAELSWQEFDFNADKNTKTKSELRQILDSFHQELDSECRHAEGILRNKDSLPWLDKLENDERNEYLRVIYTLERFVQNISSRNSEIRQQVN